MGFKDIVKKMIVGKDTKSYDRKKAYEKAAQAQIAKKAQAAYYKAQEKEAIKAAQRKAKAKYAPKKSGSGAADFFKVGGSNASFKGNVGSGSAFSGKGGAYGNNTSWSVGGGKKGKKKGLWD